MEVDSDDGQDGDGDETPMCAMRETIDLTTVDEKEGEDVESAYRCITDHLQLCGVPALDTRQLPAWRVSIDGCGYRLVSRQHLFKV